ncbi:MAG: (2Fe-2S)-binding protein [Alcaligenaceae bacterium]|nr:(2Fe-2S)-binding protein [Alcaligenaceae bacterium]
MYICICNAISERAVQRAVAEGAVELSDLQAGLGVATCCGHCADVATQYLPGGQYASVQPDDLSMAAVVVSRVARSVVPA